MQSLIVLGASARAAAFSGLRAGFAPHSIDLFSDRDLAAICPAVRIMHYPQDFAPSLAAAPPAPWIYTGGLENHPRLVERLAAIRPLWGNRSEVLRHVRDPVLFTLAAQRSGCLVPKLRASGAADGGASAWLVKPRRS